MPGAARWGLAALAGSALPSLSVAVGWALGQRMWVGGTFFGYWAAVVPFFALLGWAGAVLLKRYRGSFPVWSLVLGAALPTMFGVAMNATPLRPATLAPGSAMATLLNALGALCGTFAPLWSTIGAILRIEARLQAGE